MIKKSLYNCFQKQIILIVFLISGHLNSQIVQEFLIEKSESKTQLKERGLKGKVKTIKTCFFTIENTPKQQNIKRLLNPNIYGLYETFNPLGRLTKKVQLYPPVYFPMDTIGGDSLVYNDKGKLEKSFYTSSMGVHFIKKFNDKEDKISQEEIQKEEDSYLSNDYWSYKYNAAGKKTEAVTYSFYGPKMDKKKIGTRSYFKYDTKNRVIEEAKYGELLSFLITPKEIPVKYSYKYDLKDNLIEESCFYKTLAYKANYNYDPKNVLIKQVLVEGPKTDSAILKDGQISQRTITNRNNYIENRVYKYEYDTNGNWIKLNISTTFSENGKKQTKQETLITKEITYYE
ncbi:hypothetical protein SAMN05444671_3689 [Flavobacterium sp. CF108]|uniref:hypothetical protein n=1 Tax=unclassified Flavobacterium TaxID=196869 RepID=UPI0008C38AC8|nr:MULTISPECIES: hypothetical protein [unclassified Flavobacterium]SEO52738.1 hypothetical protein SAMN04487978_3123 [Flavobacterium sp. fv08]SHH74411.1 hypothetical protein SAMN05444671_3689 [Flavobacterium sp. CF108]